MTFKEILNELEGLGTEQNRKIYMRHGSGQNTYGVSFANLRKMAKNIGVDHELASALWDSENVDARCLSIMIADPHQLNLKTANVWLKDLTYSVLIGLLTGLVAQTDFAKVALKKWTNAKKQHKKQAGYSLLSHMLKLKKDFTKEELEDYLHKIKEEILQSSDQTKMAMNNALIAIGIYYPSLTELAKAYAKAIGPLKVDHGETACKTPDALLYIEKAISKRKQKMIQK